MGTQQVAQLVTPHRLAKELQESNTPTGVERDLKNRSEVEKKRIQELQTMRAQYRRGSHWHAKASQWQETSNPSWA